MQDSQLKKHRKTFGSSALPGPTGELCGPPDPIATKRGKGRGGKGKGREGIGGGKVTGIEEGQGRREETEGRGEGKERGKVSEGRRGAFQLSFSYKSITGTWVIQ